MSIQFRASRPPRSGRGFTLIELVVTIAVVAILTMIALPNFADTIRSNRATTIANEFNTALAVARSEAVKRNRDVRFCASDGATCTGTWAGGWLTWVDANGNNAPSADEIVSYASGPTAAAFPITEAASATQVTFTSRGRAAAAAAFAIQPAGCAVGKPYRRTITVTITGRSFVAKPPGGCV
jgi:type IV fimbrial biogenesis protein FimT